MLVCPQCGSGWLLVTLKTQFMWDQSTGDLTQYDPRSMRHITEKTPVQCEECGWRGFERDLVES